jgi:peptidoglycan/LPS O-acetylase OafA/YrhL
MPTAATQTRLGRVRSLDGLRGLAALVVLLHHSLLASSSALASAYTPTPTLSPKSFAWLLTYTPLHIIWAGPEFVIVFFVLSGFVLALPSARGGALRLASYYPSRFLRLYLPVWGALVAAALLHLAVSHSAVRGASWWLNVHSQPLQLAHARLDAALLPGAGDWGFTSVLWSLRWEVLFSLLLPVFLLVVKVRRTWTIAIAALCFELLYHNMNHDYLVYMPPFVLGVLLAVEHRQIERLALVLRRRTARNALFKLALCACCVCALSADWWLVSTENAPALVTAGACLAVVCALVVGPLGRFLDSAPMQWTGRRSYSLYLVHEPLVVVAAFLAGGRPSTIPFVLVVIPVALAAAAVFFRFVESPAHLLAQRWSAYSARAAGSHAALRPDLAERAARSSSGL